MIRLSNIVKEGEEPKKFSNEVKKHFLEIVSTYNKYQEMMDRKSDIAEIAEVLGGITEAAKQLAINETDGWFDAQTVKRNMSELDKLGNQFDKVAVEAKNLDQRLHGLYEDMGHILSRYYKIGEISEDQMKQRLGMNEMENPCWKGYEMVGTKTKDGKEVPNCVPKNESIKESNDCGCNSLNEGRSVKSLAKELYAVIEHIQGYVEIYKRKKGTPDEKRIIEKLKELNAEKKELEKRMHDEVSSLYKDVELDIKESVSEASTAVLKPGTKVKLRGGKTGKIVRFDGRTPGSPFYVVDIGQYYSVEVPAHELQAESVNESSFVKGKTYGGTKCEGGCYVGKNGLIKLIKISKENPNNVFMFRDDNYSGIQPHFIKNGVIAKATTINPSYDLDKSKVRNFKIGNDVILSVRLFESVDEAAYGYSDSKASYINNHKDEYKTAEKMNNGNEQKFYDSLSALEEKLHHPKYMIFLSNALRGYGVDMYKDPKIKNQKDAEKALFLLSK